LDILLACALFVTGLAFGSFLNVAISRIPRDLSIASPRSRCPNCKAPISWRDNIPLLSWLLLRGRCRSCGARISLRYPVVELLQAVLFLASYAVFGFSWLALKACVYCFLVLGLIFMDAETGLLPHEFTYSGIALGFVFACLAAFDASGTVFLLRVIGLGDVPAGWKLWLIDSIGGAAFGAAFFYIAWALYYLVRKRQGLGMGDIALIAMLGVFLGLKLTVLVVFLSPILATLFALALLLLYSRSTASAEAENVATGALPSRSWLFEEVPFGVFLGASGLVALFLGERIWSAYLGMFR
jgi:leader peptidase (prepilin peptidase)/N-methyltransferase